MKIELPKAGEWNQAENYAENLRETSIAGQKGCVTAGNARIVLNDAGARTMALADGSILSIGADLRSVYVNGVSAGKLADTFLSATESGDHTLIFTESGPEWLGNGVVEGGNPGAQSIEFSESARQLSLTAEVVAPAKFTGVYNRLTEALQPEDRAAMKAPIAAALQSLSSRARLRGMLTQPAWVAWQLRDSSGNIIARGEPQRFGQLQGSSVMSFNATKSGTTFSTSGSASLEVAAYGLRLKAGRSGSAFWRNKVKQLEVVTWPDCMAVKGCTGRFTASGTDASVLTVSADLEETERSGPGTVAAIIESPLEGIDVELDLQEICAATWGTDPDRPATLKPVETYAMGQLNAYVEASDRSSITLARADDPLNPLLSAKVSRGDILRICAPVGSGGGWNYGRRHLLAFATDGIYAVSIDTKLTTISATRINSDGISRRDAVCESPGALYVATVRGRVLKFTGTRASEVLTPFDSVVAVVWNHHASELMVMNHNGRIAALSLDGRVSVRSVFNAVRFVEPAMAVEPGGKLRDFSREEAGPVPVVWRRREPATGSGVVRRVEWTLDTERAIALNLELSAENGGAPQRVVTLTVNGPINAPVGAMFRMPRRRYITASLSGVLTPPARLTAVTF